MDMLPGLFGDKQEGGGGVKGKCKFLDYENNACTLNNQQCEGKEYCFDYQESED